MLAQRKALRYDVHAAFLLCTFCFSGQGFASEKLHLPTEVVRRECGIPKLISRIYERTVFLCEQKTKYQDWGLSLRMVSPTRFGVDVDSCWRTAPIRLAWKSEFHLKANCTEISHCPKIYFECTVVPSNQLGHDW